MQIILLKSVRGVGTVGKIAEVADGYGRNYLIPQELAVRATKENIAKFQSSEKALQEKNSEAKKQAETAMQELAGKHIEFITQSAADGRLFGSVSLKSIAARITELVNMKLNYSNILLDAPIKFNGVYEVQIALHPEVISSVLVVVAKTESEAKDALMEFKEGGAKAEEEAREEELNAILAQTNSELSAEAEEIEANAARLQPNF